MKQFIIGALLFASSLLVNAQTFNVATYNLRNDNPSDVGNMWVDRKAYVAKLIVYHDFDFFGTQEALPSQLEDMVTLLPAYEYYGEGRDGHNQGEHSAIFYKKDKYRVLEKGDFWLSATPDVPSKSWDAPCCNRICTWVKLEEKASGKSFYVFSAHYDYEKDFARNESSKLVLSKLKEIAGDAPAIFVGDLNGDMRTSWCRIIHESGILRDTYYDVKAPYANNSSYNAWGKKVDKLDQLDNNIISSGDILDHIYFTKHFKAETWGMLTDTYSLGDNVAKFPSDHFPVVVKARWVE
ncbi:endonuclease/exonuclease/phosphatase family protein [Dysgonomonas macrotermitis]|uniref:Endonuclease/Exonuclease/phosphatase family protein n=1 Tax=Dysgonomonas macrotermitis TaxID=1346286 RepID=A0A1M4ZU47_9BACT|nr:endonuclease/exonuclease/phosphatase family protein [Dysgonomonas macrotermitis]SHF21357.1 Endonuclease/Exonuclease/phosphatase family protein [Dysgonomonas macrotermitis]